MRTVYVITIFCLVLVLAGSEACGRKDAVTPEEEGPEPYTLELPAEIPSPAYDFSQNPLTKQGIALGRHLFYDPKLSRDSTISCGFCHQQFAAFGHFDHALSHGIEGRIGTRSVPTLFNLIWQTEFMWDGGVNNLEIQPLTPITDPNEMGEDLANLLQRLQADANYRKMFRAAFGTEEITSQRLFRALTQFMAIMVSFGSKYDSVMRGAPGVAFTAEEQAGYTIFRQKCAACHQEPFFTDFSYRNNGLPYLPALNDVGRMKITSNTADYLKFKVPSLRNVLKSPPYMHDGRFFDIYQVFAQYDHGVEQSNTLDPLVKNGIPLSESEQRALYMFLNTLTDPGFINNEALSEILIE
ncbi:cytochrome-c peroxidase [Chitinophaga japonensis]|uniref:Cytochrome c peroxidase n=1 Tax=Chitinophaga japonensis TaxID=104662 RepID=A0A562T553_CHIJA|nr:cytochrome c peroxidase [Chitinophaga japonensis]TWI88503.1 cytochrome c peroxidase [Chitinophaga japonensis]